MTFVKICGIRTLEDAGHAVRSGANAIGLNFFSQSPRAISPDAAQLIVEALPPEILTVGIFVDSSQSEIEAIAKHAGLHAVQLMWYQQLENLPAELKVIRAFRPQTGYELQAILANRPKLDYLLLDAYSKDMLGGTGEEIAVSMLETLKQQNLLESAILAGGLTPENVYEKVLHFRPFGVDVASGVESSPGIKDPAKVEAFIAAVRRAEAAIKDS